MYNWSVNAGHADSDDSPDLSVPQAFAPFPSVGPGSGLRHPSRDLAAQLDSAGIAPLCSA